MRALRTYEEARAYSKTISKTGSILGLTSIKNLMRELGNVQEKLQILHIAGTNGKGSTGAFLAAILKEAGFSVGRYTSPAVFTPLEVWSINGINISKEEYCKILSQVKDACDILVSKGMPHPTIFEVETAVAFLYFYQKKCDYVLLETGMGGKEDATNLIQKPVCSILTSISMDHMKFLGNTLSEIAAQKAGIIKKGCPVFTSMQKEEALAVILKEAGKMGAKLTVANPEGYHILQKKEDSTMFVEPDLGELAIPMAGEYQIFNVSLAIETAKWLLQKEQVKNAKEIIKNGLKKAYWPGRFELLLKEPDVIVDGAHNEDAAIQLKKTVENCFTNRRITYIIGVLADKEHEKMLKIMLPLAAKVYTVTPHNDRALSGELLAKEARKFHPDVTEAESVKKAVVQALNQSKKEDVILVFGSLSYLAEVKEAVKKATDRKA